MLGKGGGKGSASSRAPWSALQPCPGNLFSDAQNEPLEQISLSQVNAKAKGYFLAAGKDADHFLSITSNHPLAMIAPNSDVFRDRLKQAKLGVIERQIAFFDPMTELTTPRKVFFVTLGADVKIADAKPDVAFQPPPQLAELAVDIDLAKIDTKLQFEFTKDMKTSFKQYIDAALGAKHVQQMYSVDKTGQIVSGLIKVPSVHLEHAGFVSKWSRWLVRQGESQTWASDSFSICFDSPFAAQR